MKEQPSPRRNTRLGLGRRVRQQLTLREGEEVQMLGRDHEKLTFRWESFIGQEKQDQLVAELQQQIEELQDKVDAYNATTEL